MNDIFSRVLYTCIIVNLMIIAMILVRYILEKTPKKMRCILWGIIAIRMVCPITIESSFSFIPTVLADEAVVEDWIEYNILNASRDVDKQFGLVETDAVIQRTGGISDKIFSTMCGVWISGIAILAIFYLVKYVMLYKKMSISIPVKDNVYMNDEVSSPFVFGIIRTRIYIPPDMTEEEYTYVLAHESTHLKRHDHIWKLVAVSLLIIYWFNPFCWLAYFLFCCDIELACDERVINKTNNDYRVAYAQTILNFHRFHRSISVYPLTFGGGGVKVRIGEILNYKQPTILSMSVAIATCLVIAVGFLTIPKMEKTETVSSRELIQAVLEEPHLVDLFLFDNYMTAIQWLYENSKVTNELLNRKNVTEDIIKFQDDIRRNGIENAEEEIKNNALEMLLKYIELQKGDKND